MLVLLHRCFLSNFFQPLLASAGDTFKEQSLALIMAMLSSATATAETAERRQRGKVPNPRLCQKCKVPKRRQKTAFVDTKRVGNEKRVILKEFLKSKCCRLKAQRVT